MVTENLQVFVAIDAHPKAGALLRVASSKAKELNGKWAVIYVETPEHEHLSKEARNRLLQHLTSAEEMGARIIRIENKDAARGMLAAIEQANSTGISVHTLVIGKTPKEGFWDELQTSIAEKIAKQLRSQQTSLQVIPLFGAHYKPSWFERLQLQDISFKILFFSFLSVCIAYGLSEIIRSLTHSIEWQLNTQNVTALFLIATIIPALRYGMIAGLFAAVCSFACINFFYARPFHSFQINHVSETLNLIIFLLSAGVISVIGAYSRSNSKFAARKERRTKALHTLYRNASEANDRDQALKIMHSELSGLLEMQVAFFLPQTMKPGQLELAYPASLEMSKSDHSSLDACWNQARTTGLGAALMSRSSWRFEPMVTSRGEMGVLGIKVPGKIKIDASFGRLICAIADHAANILERIELTEMMDESRMREERERLRAMLLSSVSHDLKTPLASIIGSLSVYKRMKKAGRLTDDAADELTETALDEAHRLDSFISNILDMTRIESGDIRFNHEWVEPELMLSAVKKRLRLRLRDHTLQITPHPHPIEVCCDAMMTEQVLQNVIDNAAKYSPKGACIKVSYQMSDNGCQFTIQDQGEGIPDNKLEIIFDKYERLKQSDSQVAGTGLGLAICRAIMEKQKGTILASNSPNGGALFTINLPEARKKISTSNEAIT